MKAILEFNLPEEQEEFHTAVNAGRYKATLDDIWQHVFRPAYKHGYSKEGLTELSDRDYEVIDKLAELYRQVLREWEQD